MRQIASLPMYDLPALRAATDAWWAALAARLRAAGFDGVPDALGCDLPFGREWTDRRLLLSQCCGADLLRLLDSEHPAAPRPVATPIYDAPGCQGGDYRSALLVRAGDPAQSLADLRGRRAAVNMPGSHSGDHALRWLCAPLSRDGRFFSEVVITGAHLASLAALRNGDADIAAIDMVTLTLAGDTTAGAATRGLRTLALSPRAPGLPYITRRALPDDRLAALRAALYAQCDDRRLAPVRRALRLKGFVVYGEDRYRRGRTAAMTRRAGRVDFGIAAPGPAVRAL